ncbi:MAG: S24 family peptidase [Alistipes sp.]|nr:S24 family peptidase [Alistipes sp.]
MCVKERIKKFIEYKKLPTSKFEELCDLSNGYISAMRKGFGNDKLNNVLTAFPDLNREWLLFGEGEMLKVPATLTVFHPTAAEQQELAEGVDMSVVPAEVVEEIREELRPEVVEEIKEEMAIPIISSEVANSPNTDIKKYVKDKADELERIYLGDLLPAGAKVAERVRKTSMLPTFQPGDWVFVKFINKDNITDGETYYFDFNTRPTMIRKVKIEGDNLRLIAKNPQFGDINIKREEINNIGDIVGLFRGYFGDQYDDIEAMRRKKDEQVNTLIEQNGQALHIIRDLIKK